MDGLGYWHCVPVLMFACVELHIGISVSWDVLSCVLADANICTLVMETAGSTETTLPHVPKARNIIRIMMMMVMTFDTRHYVALCRLCAG
jgi:hypothetical protein